MPGHSQPPLKNPAGRIYRKIRRVFRDLRRQRLRTKIATTAPSPPANRNVPFSPHALVCHRDVLLSVCSAKSLNLAMGEALPWIFHDDGSVTQGDTEMLLRQFPGCKLIKRHESDLFYEGIKASCAPLPDLRRKHFMLLKVADLSAFSDRDRILYVDSDILFFRHPTFLVEKLRDPGSGNFFNRDIDTAYIAPPKTIHELTGIVPPARINAGLSVLNRPDISISKIAKLLSMLDVRKRTHWSFYDHLIEQTVVALLAADSPSGAHLLPHEYDVCFDRPLEGAVSRHYVGAIRHLFELEGLRYLTEKLSFIERWQEFSETK